MRLSTRIALLSVLALTVVSGARAQQHEVRTMLIARGAPAEFADQVMTIVDQAEANHLPTEPLVSKALEGWAKRGRVPADRVLSVMTQLRTRLQVGRELAMGAGLEPPPGAVVAAAAGALGRGMRREDVTEIIESAPAPDAAATGLTVASALAAQGLERAAAVRAVGDAFRGGRTLEEVLEFPSVVTGLRAHGEPMAGIARRILEGGGLPMPMGQGGGMGGQAGRPSGVPGAQPGSAQGQQKKKQSGQSGNL
jgi:hypothetical protein